MDLQTIFYTLGIIFMVSWLLFFIGFVIFAFIIYRRIKAFQEEAMAKANEFASMSKTQIATMIGAAVATYLTNKVRSMFKRSD